MFITCNGVIGMSKMLQVRNVPDDVHRTLKSRAALAGKSLSDWVLDELERLARLPSEEELLERLRRAEPFVMKQSSSKLLRKDRDAA